MRPGRSRRDGILIPKNIQLRECSLFVVVADYFIPIPPGWGSTESHTLFSYVENDDRKTFGLTAGIIQCLGREVPDEGRTRS